MRPYRNGDYLTERVVVYLTERVVVAVELETGRYGYRNTVPVGYSYYEAEKDHRAEVTARLLRTWMDGDL